MVISFASRSASRMISSYALRRISARSRGFFAAEPGNAALAASTAALASSTVALATEATLFSVAGSITSKRPPSEDLRHLPPIHRSVGTLARRLSYMVLVPALIGKRHTLPLLARLSILPAGCVDRIRIFSSIMNEDDFEWDDDKAAQNYSDHGVSFEAAKRIFK